MGDHCTYIGAMHCPSSGGKKNGNAQFLSCVHGKWGKVDTFERDLFDLCRVCVRIRTGHSDLLRDL